MAVQDDINTLVGTLGAIAAELQQGLNGINAEIAATDAQIADLQAQLSALGGGAVTVDLDPLKAQVAVIQGAADAISAAATSNVATPPPATQGTVVTPPADGTEIPTPPVDANRDVDAPPAVADPADPNVPPAVDPPR